MSRLQLYTLDLNYGTQLEQADNKVFVISPQNKQCRPFVGVVVVLDNKTYCVPLSSPKPKHNNIKDGVDFSKIYDKNGKLIGVLNFNNMIPVNKHVIKPIYLLHAQMDNPQESKYKDLLNNDLTWCNNNKDSIMKKARNVYSIVTTKPEVNPKLCSRCCDFKKLESILERHTKGLFIEPYYIAITDPHAVRETLDNNGIVYKISHKKNDKGKYALKINMEDKNKVKQLLSPSVKAMSL